MVVLEFVCVQLYSTQFEISLFLFSFWKSLQNGAKVVQVPLLLTSKITFIITRIAGFMPQFPVS